VFQRVGSSDELLRALAADREFGAILIDQDLPALGGLRAAQALAADHYPAPLIVLGDQADRAAAEAILRAGAVDYVIRRPGYAQAMPRILRGALEIYRSRAALGESSRRQAELAALLTLQRGLCGERGDVETWSALADQLAAVCPYDHLAVWSSHGRFAWAEFVRSTMPGIKVGARRRLARTPIAQAFSERRIVTIGPVGQSAIFGRVPSTVVAPLIVNGDAVAVAELRRADADLDDGHVRFLSAALEQIAAARELATRRSFRERDRQRQRRATAIRRMGSEISQQLTQPLSLMIGYGQLLRNEQISPADAVVFWERIERSGQKLTRLLHRLGGLDTALLEGLSEEPDEVEWRSLLDDEIPPVA
jgi:CheY-like chemotaxis protein